jgi:hypothetical protein
LKITALKRTESGKVPKEIRRDANRSGKVRGKWRFRSLKTTCKKRERRVIRISGLMRRRGWRRASKGG